MKKVIGSIIVLFWVMSSGTAQALVLSNSLELGPIQTFAYSTTETPPSATLTTYVHGLWPIESISVTRGYISQPSGNDVFRFTAEFFAQPTADPYAYSPISQNTSTTVDGVNITELVSQIFASDLLNTNVQVSSFIEITVSSFYVTDISQEVIYLNDGSENVICRVVWQGTFFNQSNTNIPEPASLSMLSLAALGLLIRRR